MIDRLDAAFHRVMGAICEVALRRIETVCGMSCTVVLYRGREVIFAANLDPDFDSNELRQLEHPGRLLETEGIEQNGHELREFSPKPN